ncbi:MAG: NB-ARC domain-containing protein, partial [Oscillatoriales cyanobacterium]
QGNTVFSDLWDLLDRQFDRLSPLQQQIMYWLAINQEAATPAKLKAEILPEVSGRQLMEALEALAERSLIFDERSLNYTASTSLMLQPAIAEYVRERLLERNCRSSNIELLINARN